MALAVPLHVALVLPSTRPSVEIKNPHIVESKGETLTFELKATKADVFREQSLMGLNNLSASIYSDTPEPYVLNGPRGALHTETQDFRILEEAEILTPDGYQFIVDGLLYTAKTRRIESPGALRGIPGASPRTATAAAEARFSIQGVGLEIFLDEHLFVIKSQVSAKQRIGANNELEIKSRLARIRPRKNVSMFQDNVTVKSPSMFLEGDELELNFSEGQATARAPRDLELRALKEDTRIRANLPSIEVTSKGLRVEFSADGTVDRSYAMGAAEGRTKDGIAVKAEELISDTFQGRPRIRLKSKVEIVTDSRVATCEEAVIFSDTGEIFLSRTASVKTATQTLEGESIRFSTKNSEVIVERASGNLQRSEILKK